MITQSNVVIETGLHSNGKVRSRTYRNSKKETSRDPRDGPADEIFHSNGNILIREYVLDGVTSRDPKDGPAYEQFNSDGRLTHSAYWLNGKRLTDAEVQSILNPPAPKPVPAPVILPEITITVNGERFKLVKE